jgi:AcrR family transcriptional regulator
MTRATRTHPKIRKEKILKAAVKLSIKLGYKNITRDRVAELADVSSALVGNYFPRMADLKNAVMRTAIQQEIVEIIAQGLTLKDPRVLKISKTLRGRIMEFLKIK